MDIILTAAITFNGLIARHQREVVDWSRDLALFREQTMGFPVIMGSITAETLATELDGRQIVVIHRHDDPAAIIDSLESQRCFIIGGSRTYAHFAPFLTHFFLTFHPQVFAGGIPLFTGLKAELELELINILPVFKGAGIFQYQYRLKNSDNDHSS